MSMTTSSAAIAWAYLDKKAAAADALRDFHSMIHIVVTHDTEEAIIRERMTALPSPAPSGVPGAHNPTANETRIAAQLDEIDVLQERYRRAAEYMAWFKPAWLEMSEDEQYVLNEFYLNGDNSQEDVVGNICNRFHIARSSAYKKKDRALAKLSVLLYGK